MSWAVRLNFWTLGLTRHWLKGVVAFFAVWSILPFVAPTLMRLGATDAAQAVYNLYSPMCHRFPFRSFFLYGEQPAYPLADVASYTGLRSFESYAGRSNTLDNMVAGVLPVPPFGVTTMAEFAGIELNGEYAPITIPDNLTPTDTLSSVNFARLQLVSASFIGNEQMGYKMTVCERDVSIYWGFLVAGLVYSVPVVRRKLRPIPILLYIFIGLGPIGLDGFSQMLGYPPFSWWPPRETTPLLRVVTGFIFGLMTAWLGFVNIEDSMRDTRRIITNKLRRAGLFPA
ncbi:MAG: DUF2085 domain-containing protein [Anaerolineae bacterium]|jgi:uncharacterized membrane protein|nr:DUF2085 domain-containing protein [Anaerolineae bacterium]